MKLALVLFFVCGFLLGCSLQQQVLFHSSGSNPNIFPRTMMPYYHFSNKNTDDTNEMNHQFYEPSNGVQNRPAMSPFFKSTSYNNNHPQNRLFRFLLLNQLKNSLFSSLPTVTFTSTSTSVSTKITTITTLAFQNCISIANFASAAVAGPFSTTPCPGRKRSIDLDVAFEPSKVILMETSRIVRNDGEQNSDLYSLSSSFSDLEEESDIVTPRKVGYSQVSPIVIPKSTLVVTATTTTTSFSFIASTVKKPFTLAAAGALTCLPPGFVVC